MAGGELRLEILLFDNNLTLHAPVPEAAGMAALGFPSIMSDSKTVTNAWAPKRFYRQVE
jgi:hypothetical protein